MQPLVFVFKLHSTEGRVKWKTPFLLCVTVFFRNVGNWLPSNVTQYPRSIFNPTISKDTWLAHTKHLPIFYFSLWYVMSLNKRISVFWFKIILLYSVICNILLTNSACFCAPCYPFFGSGVLIALSVKKEHGFVAVI